MPLALPMIVRKHPPPERTMVGTLADAASTRRFLELDGRDAGQEEEHAAAAEGGDSP